MCTQRSNYSLTFFKEVPAYIYKILGDGLNSELGTSRLVWPFFLKLAPLPCRGTKWVEKQTGGLK
jgi:hypothetical protein